jgi:hypothetical protein
MKQNETGLFEVEVDGKNYEFEKWGAEASLSVLIKIAKIAGKPLGMVLGMAMEKKGLDTDISADLLGDAVQSLLENMDEEVCISLIKRISSEKVLCEGRPIKFNDHYQNKLGHLFKVVKAALEVQYGDFFGELVGLIPAPKPTGKAKIANHKQI